MHVQQDVAARTEHQTHPDPLGKGGCQGLGVGLDAASDTIGEHEDGQGLDGQCHLVWSASTWDTRSESRQRRPNKCACTHRLLAAPVPHIRLSTLSHITSDTRKSPYVSVVQKPHAKSQETNGPKSGAREAIGGVDLKQHQPASHGGATDGATTYKKCRLTSRTKMMAAAGRMMGICRHHKITTR